MGLGEAVLMALALLALIALATAAATLVSPEVRRRRARAAQARAALRRLGDDLEAALAAVAADPDPWTALARDPAVPARTGAQLAFYLGGNEAEALLFGRASAPLLGATREERLAAAAGLVESGLARDRTSGFGRAAAALVLLAEERPDDAWELLDACDHEGECEPTVLALRSGAAAGRGDAGQARELIERAVRAAGGEVPAGAAGWTLRGAVDHVARLA